MLRIYNCNYSDTRRIVNFITTSDYLITNPHKITLNDHSRISNIYDTYTLQKMINSKYEHNVKIKSKKKINKKKKNKKDLDFSLV